MRLQLLVLKHEQMVKQNNRRWIIGGVLAAALSHDSFVVEWSYSSAMNPNQAAEVLVAQAEGQICIKPLTQI